MPLDMESQTLKITTVFTLVGALFLFIWNAHSWAEDKHQTLRETVQENSKQISVLVVTIQLLSQVQQQQVKIIKEAADDASEKGRTLVRIETKLETLTD